MKINKKTVFGLLGIIFFILISMASPPEGLTGKSMMCLGIFAWAVCCWVGEVLPFLVTCMGIFCLLVLSGAAGFATAVSGFSSSVICFILGAMGISVALTKSGLMRRISFYIMKLFSPTFKGQTIGLTVAGLVINPMVPSVTAKTAMIMPISKGISDAMGYKPFSKGMYGIWCACFTGVTLASYGFYNSNFVCLFAKGMLPEDVQLHFNLVNWFIAAVPWLVIVLGGMILCINLLYKPEDDGTAVNREYIAEELKKMGSLSKEEKICLAVLLVSVVLWAFENYTGLPSHVIAVAAVVILMAAKVINTDDFVHGVGWNMVMIIALLMGLSNAFAETGINDWIAVIITPVVDKMAGNVFLLMTVIVLVVYALRFAITSQIAAIPVLLSMFLPVCDLTGINPWVITFAALTSNAIWTVMYQNVYSMQGFAAYNGEKGMKYSQVSKAGVCFMVLNLAAIMACIPVWSLMGLMG